ncbi:Phosphatidylglycerol/phosphatidylinositol transfer protein [Dermatophagoides pteronyssinus]|uniref:Phosphatidylglycerol/phosphatidylinositol transfer protein n=1 Tax=Dermatophagoides pteronyssinus TaxID=6956 RepID=A0ABQ8IXW8_DERPT|nr:Phosphatidylglycerol/phosphatidylinositol transfer protein [Dermatophagoides pteronyssinus]
MSKFEFSQLFKNCSSNSGHIQSINISDCSDNDSYCRLKKGGDVLMHLDFVADKAYESVKLKIFGEIARIKVPFHITPDEACGNYGLKCPLVPGQTNRFNLSLPIKSIYPSIPVNVNLNLMAGDTDDKIVCIRFKAKISN